MIGIIDYGAGNVGNVQRALSFHNERSTILRCPDQINNSIDLLILPGVGAFAPAMSALEKEGWPFFLSQWVEKGHPLLGICLGLHLLCEGGEEGGYRKGLGFLEGVVRHLGTQKYPHMGWNSLEWIRSAQGLEKSCHSNDYFYFVHSYGLPQTNDTVAIARVEEREVSAICLRDSVAAFQFHPERSGSAGLSILKGAIDLLRRHS
ncbi:imidazole glycerol phosphate synthase subunit HisH [Aminobacterium colombiense]|jgi:glutamine amidotransferase|uniref:imidazole glycerol phosphate synthase subunit HisH n=1 Tax=Aminobacterium colombiense TaxID=81468 RepID=UPI001BCD6AA9